MATVQETLHEIDLMRPRTKPLELAPGDVYYADHAITVDEFYELVDDEDCDAELVDGGFELRAEWLWMPEEKRPTVIKTVQRLLRRAGK